MCPWRAQEAGRPKTAAERRAEALAEKEKLMEDAYNDALSWLEVGRGIVGATRSMMLQRTLKGEDNLPRSAPCASRHAALRSVRLSGRNERGKVRRTGGWWACTASLPRRPRMRR